jgi:putative hemolysin
MDGESPLYSFFVFLIFILLNAIFFAFGESLRKTNQSELEKKAEEGHRRSRRLKKILDNSERFDNTNYLIFGITCVVVGYFQVKVFGVKLIDFFILKFGSFLNDSFINLLSYIIIALYLMFILLSLGIILPRKLGAKYSSNSILAFSRIITFVMWILRPLTFLSSFLADLILRAFGINPHEELLNVTEAEIISMVNEGHEQGVLEEREAEMISNIIELDEKQAYDIMIHRKHIYAIDGEWTLEKTMEFILEESFSRFPVYIESIDNVIGVLHIRDVMNYYISNKNLDIKIKDIEGIIRNPHFVPETRTIDGLFKDMQLNKMHMVIVIDEYGQTSGLISMEDIIEEIVGNIMDEYDEEEYNIIKENDNVFLMKGMAAIDEVAQTLGIDIDDEEFDTLNGYLISKLDRIPAENEMTELIIDKYSYKIINVKDKMISLVRVTKLVEKANEEILQ